MTILGGKMTSCNSSQTKNILIWKTKIHKQLLETVEAQLSTCSTNEDVRLNTFVIVK